MKFSEWCGEAVAKATSDDGLLGRRVSRENLLEARLAARRSAAAERTRVRENVDKSRRRSR